MNINCLEITCHDIIVEKDTSRIFMVDYEHTYLNSKYKKISYDQVLSNKLMRHEDTKMRRKFIRGIKKIRHNFSKYYKRGAYSLGVYFFMANSYAKKVDCLL